jgi:prepilin-type N-terminal cleavage/methylation domain-containing protein
MMAKSNKKNTNKKFMLADIFRRLPCTAARNGNNERPRGFTLIELLVVIAIIAILSIVVVLTLNPAEMLRRSHDSNRVSDLSTIKTAIGLYLADASSTSMGTSTVCYVQQSAAGTMASGTTNIYEFASSTTEAASLVPYLYSGTTGAACGQWFNTALLTAPTTSRSVTAGWIPVNLSQISSGAPIGQWPADPAWSTGSPCIGPGCNTSAGHFYSYISGVTNNRYKLEAKMESVLYSGGGANDMESTDGGTDANTYEQGTDLTL